jgi:hypothetical protein
MSARPVEKKKEEEEPKTFGQWLISIFSVASEKAKEVKPSKVVEEIGATREGVLEGAKQYENEPPPRPTRTSKKAKEHDRPTGRVEEQPKLVPIKKPGYLQSNQEPERLERRKQMKEEEPKKTFVLGKKGLDIKTPETKQEPEKLDTQMASLLTDEEAIVAAEELGTKVFETGTMTLKQWVMS